MPDPRESVGTIIVFARAPVPGRTKTRLIPALGAEGAAELHRALLRHILEAAAAARPQALELWAAGSDDDGELAAMAKEFGARLFGQTGENLGVRMEGALAAATARGGPALVVGSDCPWLDSSALSQALAALDGHDAVLGPAHDGGYVLLGLWHAEPALFRGIPWGTDRVLALTRERLSALDWDWWELEIRGDIDRPDDLPALQALGEPWSGLLGR